MKKVKLRFWLPKYFLVVALASHFQLLAAVEENPTIFINNQLVLTEAVPDGDSKVEQVDIHAAVVTGDNPDQAIVAINHDVNADLADPQADVSIQLVDLADENTEIDVDEILSGGQRISAEEKWNYKDYIGALRPGIHNVMGEGFIWIRSVGNGVSVSYLIVHYTGSSVDVALKSGAVVGLISFLLQKSMQDRMKRVFTRWMESDKYGALVPFDEKEALTHYHRRRDRSAISKALGMPLIRLTTVYSLVAKSLGTSTANVRKVANNPFLSYVYEIITGKPTPRGLTGATLANSLRALLGQKLYKLFSLHLSIFALYSAASAAAGLETEFVPLDILSTSFTSVVAGAGFYLYVFSLLERNTAGITDLSKFERRFRYANFEAILLSALNSLATTTPQWMSSNGTTDGMRAWGSLGIEVVGVAGWVMFVLSFKEVREGLKSIPKKVLNSVSKVFSHSDKAGRQPNCPGAFREI